MSLSNPPAHQPALDTDTADSAFPPASTTSPPTRPHFGYPSPDGSHPFETRWFYEAWWKHLAPHFPIIASEGQLVSLRKPVLKGLHQLQALRVAGWNNHYYQNLNEARFEEFLTLSHALHWDYFELYWNEAYTDSQYFEAFQYFGYEPIQAPGRACPIICTGQGWEAYWQSKSKRYQRDLSKKMQDAQTLEPQLVFYKHPTEITHFFQQFFPLHQAHWDRHSQDGSYFHHPHERHFIVDWAQALAQQGQLELTGLLLGGKIANLAMSIIHDNNWYGLLTINTGLFPDLHPGLINMHLTIQSACERRFTKMDLGPSDSHYKRKLATHYEAGSILLLPNPQSLAGRFYCRWREQKAWTHYEEETLSRPSASENGGGSGTTAEG